MLSEQEQIRRDSLQKVIDYGINPYPAAEFKVSHYSVDILENFKVDFTFLNTVNKSNMIKRLKSRKKLNRYDKFHIDFYDRVQKGYLKMSRMNKNKYQIINSNIDIQKNKELIIKKVDQLLK